MPFMLSPPDTAFLRSGFLDGDQKDFYGHVGAYVCWFASAELAITAMLAHALDMPDLDAFSYISRGMDARAKVERFMATDKKRADIGPNLKAHLERFKKVSIKIRNTIAHSHPQPSSDRLYFYNIGDYHQYIKADQKTKSIELLSITWDDLIKETMWLNLLSADLDPRLVMHPKKRFEIDEPRSGLPPANHHAPLALTRYAIPQTPEKTPPA